MTQQLADHAAELRPGENGSYDEQVARMFAEMETVRQSLQRRAARLQELVEGMNSGTFTEREKQTAQKACSAAEDMCTHHATALCKKRATYDTKIADMRQRLLQRRQILSQFDDALDGQGDLATVLVEEHAQLQSHMQSMCSDLIFSQ